MSFRHVLGLLDDDREAAEVVLEDAVRLAEADHARLTLAKTTDPGPLIRWLRPCAIFSLPTPITELLSAEAEFKEAAGHRLARAAEFVPSSIPITTLLLGPDTGCALRALLQTGAYDVLVANALVLARNPRLSRELTRLGVCALAIPRPAPRPTGAHQGSTIGAAT